MTESALEVADREWSSAPRKHRPINEADVARWEGLEPVPVTFAVPDLVPIGMTTVLAADGGAGKSLLQQTAVSAIAIAAAFLGRQCLDGRAAGIFAEDPDNVLHMRQERINRAIGADYMRLSGRLFIQSYAGADATMWRDGRPTPFLDAIERDLAKIQDLRLVAIDNAAMVYADDENDRPNVTRFMGRLNGLAERLGAAVLLSIHTSKSSSDNSRNIASGSTAWIFAARSALLLTPATQDTPPMLKLAKANHAKPGLEIKLKWERAVLVPDVAPAGMVAAIETRNRDKALLDAIRVATTEKNQTLSEHNTRPNYLPKVLHTLGLCRDVKRPEIEQAMIRLKAEGLVEIREVGRTAHRKPITSLMVVEKAA